MNDLNKKYEWVTDFIKYELEGRTEEEQKELLKEFITRASRLLEEME